MPTERLAPDAILSSTNLSGSVADIQDDPDNPDADKLVASDTTADTGLTVSFPTPSGDPAGLQEFRLQAIRAGDAGGNDPTLTIDLYDGGTFVETVATQTLSASSSVVSGSWDADTAGLNPPDGSGVELVFSGVASSGSPGDRRTVEVGAVEWNAAVAGIAVGSPAEANWSVQAGSVDAPITQPGETASATWFVPITQPGLSGSAGWTVSDGSADAPVEQPAEQLAGNWSVNRATVQGAPYAERQSLPTELADRQSLPAMISPLQSEPLEL